MQYAVGTQYAVSVSAKRSTHTVDLANTGWWGPLPLVLKGHTPHSWGCSTQEVLVEKRSTHTVDLANMGGGDHYL